MVESSIGGINNLPLPRHCFLGLIGFLSLLASLLFVPVFFSVLEDRVAVDSLPWVESSLKISAIEYWEHRNADFSTGTIVACGGTGGNSSNATVTSDPACSHVVSYKISPGGTLIQHQADLLEPKTNATM